MADKSKIEWTQATWNPIRGCSLVSEGCRNCYAMGVAWRFSGAGMAYEGLAKQVNGHPAWTGEVRFVEEHLKDPLKWKEPRRIFVNSMSDLFHEKIRDEWIDRIFAVMALARQHTFQILTKRPERMRTYCSDPETRQRVGFEIIDLAMPLKVAAMPLVERPDSTYAALKLWASWPLPNVWPGVSCEDQETAIKRIPPLLATPAAVRWVSLEPLLGPIELRYIRRTQAEGFMRPLDGRFNTLDWVVVGGESGPGARPMHPDWARSLRDQCVEAEVPFFFKQWGSWGMGMGKPSGAPGRFAIVQPSGRSMECPSGYPRSFDSFGAVVLEHMGKKEAGRLLDGEEWNQYPEAKES